MKPTYPGSWAPDSLDVVASYGKTVLLRDGVRVGDIIQYKDELVLIEFIKRWQGEKPLFEIRRLPMPGHEAGELHHVENPVYQELGGDIVRRHDKIRWISVHLRNLARKV